MHAYLARVVCTCFLYAGVAQAQEPPALVVVLAVDQLRGDYLDRYGAQFTGGLARLAREGAVFSNAHQDHAMTSTAAGHGSMLSGRYPSSTGITRNAAGVNDSAFPLVGAQGGGSSPNRFRGTTLFDWMKTRWPGSRALAAGGDDRNAITVLGRAREEVYWSVNGQFVTSRYYSDSLPDWVLRYNADAWPLVHTPRRRWDLLRPAEEYPEPDSQPWENRGADFTFPHVGPDDSTRAAARFRYMPWGDSLTLDFLLRGVAARSLGRGPGPDLLIAGLATADDIGHAFGPGSREIRDYLLRLDGWLGSFLDSLERSVGRGRLLLVLTSDHGVTPMPESAWARGDTSAHHVRMDAVLQSWHSRMQQSTGEARPILWFSSGMIALNRRGLMNRGVRMDTLLERMKRDLERIPGVARVQTRADLARRTDTTRDDVTRRWRRSFEPDSPAELFVTLHPGSTFSPPGGPAQHGQNATLETHVALVLWGPGIRPGRYDEKASVVDIAPTLAHLLGVAPAERLDGTILQDALHTP